MNVDDWGERIARLESLLEKMTSQSSTPVVNVHLNVGDLLKKKPSDLGEVRPYVS